MIWGKLFSIMGEWMKYYNNEKIHQAKMCCGRLDALAIRFNRRALLFSHALAIPLLLFQTWPWPVDHHYESLSILRET